MQSRFSFNQLNFIVKLFTKIATSLIVFITDHTNLLNSLTYWNLMMDPFRENLAYLPPRGRHMSTAEHFVIQSWMCGSI